MKMNYFIGIDVGTSGTKSVLFDESGKIIADAYREYPMYQPHNGWAEQDAEDWKNAAFETIRELSAAVCTDDIKGIGVSGQMHGLVMLDEENNVLDRSLIWCDQRTSKQVDEVCEVIGREKYIELTYNAPNTSFTLFKLLWIKKNKPEIYSKIKKVLLPKDYINFCLTGNYVTDVSDAGGTGYFSVKDREWCDEILDAFGIDKSILPEVKESCEVAGALTAQSAEMTGLSTSVTVAAGAGDQAAAALGNGIVGEGDMSISMGTSGVVFSAVNNPIFDKQGRIHTLCHSVPGMFHVMGVTQSCGLSLSWFKHNFAENKSYKELDAEASDISSDGIVFLPYLMGERTPHLDPDCRGSFTGISAGHTTANLYRAVLEGVCYSLKDCFEIMKSTGLSAGNIGVCGGGANSNLWLQILADILGADVCKNDNSESGARGVAILASVASCFYSDVPTAAENMNSSVLTPFVTNNENSEYYNSIYNIYKAMYSCIKEAYIAQKTK